MLYLAILIPEPLATQIKTVKLKIKEKFGFKHALKSPAHITIIPPFNYHNPDQIITHFQKFTFAPFGLRTKGWNHFHKKVIFLDVHSTDALAKFYQQAVCHFCQLDVPVKGIRNELHPHITVAHRDYKPSCFSGMMELIQAQSYANQFEVNQLALLNKDANDPAWQIFHVFKALS